MLLTQTSYIYCRCYHHQLNDYITKVPEIKHFKVAHTQRPTSDTVTACPLQVRGRRGVFCCVGGGPKRLFKIKLWKSPTVNIGLASATGKSGRMCKSHLDSFHNSAVIGRQRCRPNRWWVLSTLKDITHSPEETLHMLKQSDQNRQYSAIPVIAAATGNILTFMQCVTVCVHVCDNVFFFFSFLLWSRP